MVVIKIHYRVVVGNLIVVKSVISDLMLIALGLYPVYEGFRLQNLLNLEDLNATDTDIHELARGSQRV